MRTSRNIKNKPEKRREEKEKTTRVDTTRRKRGEKLGEVYKRIGNDSSTIKKITEKIGKEKDSRETRACQKKKRQISILKRKKKETS